MVCGTACLCIVIVVSVLMIVLAEHPDLATADLFGKFSKGSATGAAAILLAMIVMIQMSFGKGGTR